MQKWEYQVVEVSTVMSALGPMIDKQGEQGWELVGVIPSRVSRVFAFFLVFIGGSSRTTTVTAIFKRPLSEA